ncbi:MAG: 50S ribosomal protein L30e [Hadesarchaea archaeon]|nr:50S ribosomal protein L30e [Hadesarchaea archaeon]
MELSKEIGQAVSTGKVAMGAARSIKTLKRGQAKLVIAASNCEPNLLADIKHYAALANVPVHIFDGTSQELGLACGKPFLVSILAVVESGSSNILSIGGHR